MLGPVLEPSGWLGGVPKTPALHIAGESGLSCLVFLRKVGVHPKSLPSASDIPGLSQ